MFVQINLHLTRKLFTFLGLILGILSLFSPALERSEAMGLEGPAGAEPIMLPAGRALTRTSRWFIQGRALIALRPGDWPARGVPVATAERGQPLPAPPQESTMPWAPAASAS